MRINLTHFGVVGEDGEDLQPTENPHEVSEAFGRGLIHSGRATEHKPKEKKGEGDVQNGDPKPGNRDPKPKK